MSHEQYVLKPDKKVRVCLVLPESVASELARVRRESGISASHFVAVAVVEKLAVMAPIWAAVLKEGK